MSKVSDEIIQWGTMKPFFDKTYKFNSIDIETVSNELFILGFVKEGKYHYTLKNFYDEFHYLLISSLQENHDLVTWTRYDNTHLLKMILKDVSSDKIDDILLRVGKVSPVYEYKFNNFNIKIDNIIKDSIIFSISSLFSKKEKRVVIYNLKNLYQGDLLKTAKNYGLTYYSKMGEEYHKIDLNRFKSDLKYRKGVIRSNELDNRVIIDIANKMLEDFKAISGVYPKTIFTAGSLSRNFLMSYIVENDLDFKPQFQTIFRRTKYYDKLLDYSMRAYHGGKIESYCLGYIKKAKVIDITSAYPYAMSLLPQLTGRVLHSSNIKNLNRFFYAFIRCDVVIDDEDLIHPLIVESPVNKTNLSPYGYLENIIITKVEYDYLIRKGAVIKVYDFLGVYHEDKYPYKKIVDKLFSERMLYKSSNESLSEMYKTIINSLYGITYELTPMFEETSSGEIGYIGLRAGDFFNPVYASYITAITRTYLSNVSHDIILNGGSVYLNMTDSIIYDGEVTLDVFSDKKILGKFEQPDEVEDIIILGAGRYEYRNSLNNTYIIKNRGFSISVKDKSFYGNLDLSDIISIPHRTFVSSFKATTNKYDFKQLGHLIDDKYNINPFNLGGKRIIENEKINLNKEFTRTRPIKLEKGLL